MTAQRRYLLDTNIVSELVRQPQGAIAAQVERVGETSICTSVVVAGELRFGARKSGSKRLRTQLETILSAMEVVALEPPADQHYADLRSSLEQRGEPIGPNDMLIAAHARALDLTLVTANTSEFKRVEGLAVEDWLAA